jgi:hypothetical protein
MARDWSNLKELLPEMRAPRQFLPQSDETAAMIAAASDEPSVPRAGSSHSKQVRRSA